MNSETLWIMAGSDPNRVSGRLPVQRCPICACLIVAGETEHLVWHGLIERED